MYFACIGIHKGYLIHIGDIEEYMANSSISSTLNPFCFRFEAIVIPFMLSRVVQLEIVHRRMVAN